MEPLTFNQDAHWTLSRQCLSPPVGGGSGRVLEFKVPQVWSSVLISCKQFEKLTGNRKTQGQNLIQKCISSSFFNLNTQRQKCELAEEPDLNPQKDKFITSDINNSQENVGVIGSRFKI